MRKIAPPAWEDDFNRAQTLNRRGRRKEAIQILLRLRRSDKESAAICGVLGGLFWDENQLSRAASWFRRATKLSPKSELCSRGLFHVLWDDNRRIAALNEVRRFILAGGRSEHYDSILKELSAD